jgi:hypothetical protein
MHREIPIRLSHQARGAIVFVRCLLMHFVSMCHLFREELAIPEPTVELRCQSCSTLTGTMRAIIAALQLEDCTDTAHC